MPLKTAANVLDDATHTKLDKRLLAEFHARGLPPGIWGAYVLLTFITSDSEGCIDPKYGSTAAMSFVERNPDLQAELWKAWEAKSFKHIRNLSKSPHLSAYNRLTQNVEILRPPQPITTVTDVLSHQQEKGIFIKRFIQRNVH